MKEQSMGRHDQAAQISKSNISAQLEKFTQQEGLRSLQDRLRIGLNEAGMLAYEQTRQQIEQLCVQLTGSEDQGARVFRNVQDMIIDIQEHGPWEYAHELRACASPEVEAWYMVNYAQFKGYEKEMDLNESEFIYDVQRIQRNLQDALHKKEEFLREARHAIIDRAQALLTHVTISNNKKHEKKIERIPYDSKQSTEQIPVAESLDHFTAMAINGHRVGIAQDAEGWVFVGAQGRISDSLIESCGLTRILKPDPRDPKRELTFFLNESGQEVVKKVHRGFLVILSKDMELALKIAEAVRDEKQVVDIAKESVGFTRVKQTSEKKRARLTPTDEVEDTFDRIQKSFLRLSGQGVQTSSSSETTTLTRPKETFYDQMLYARALYVYLDATSHAVKQKKRKLTTVELEAIGESVWRKMEQKVDELRYLNDLLNEEGNRPPDTVHSVVDMAGGAGDFGLAVGTHLIGQGHDVRDIEIVDPQEGTADFMKHLIEYLPFREDLERIAHHNTGFLQDAKITPDAIVVAKHACGTLTDDTIRMWKDSESPMLMAMTCCQDKAKDAPAPYGFTQQEWHDLCVTSAMTNTEVPEEPGKSRDIALRRLEEGKRAMYELDMARVDYLRRHGFAAELRTTVRFPKGDVIIARRLPKDFLTKVDEILSLERTDPNAYDNLLQQLDRMKTKRSRKSIHERFGESWTEQDVQELLRRLQPSEEVRKEEARKSREQKVQEAFNTRLQEIQRREQEEKVQTQKVLDRLRREKLLIEVFHDADGKLSKFLMLRGSQTGRPVPPKEMGIVAKEINEIIGDGSGDAMEIRAKIMHYLEQRGN